MILADFIVERLENLVDHVFSVGGDYILPTINRISQSKKIKLINCTDEANAGFAADAYARIHGAGVVVVTYNVGALKLCNSVACAFAERSPLIVISGSPGLKERNNDYVLHHVVKGYDCQRNIFKEITCSSVVLDDPITAGYQFDKALERMDRKKQPIYIELPRDIAEKPMRYDHTDGKGTPQAPITDAQSLKEAMEDVIQYINQAKFPVILAGVQIARYRLGRELIKFAERANIPVATTMLSKSVVNEQHPLVIGTYCGSTSKNFVRQYVENSDCLLIFGEVLSDMTMGFKPAQFNRRQTVFCSVEGLKVKNHDYKDVNFKDFCNLLFKTPIGETCGREVKKSEVGKRSVPELPARVAPSPWTPAPKTKITTVRFFEKINSILNDKLGIIAEPGDCLFGAVDLMSVHQRDSFFGPAFYNSMGFAIPACLGIQLANPKLRSIVLVGDGSFQMASCTELSTILERKLNPIVFVLNNRGYTTERFIIDGAFNDIRDWAYEKMTDVIRGGVGIKVTTEEELEEAVTAALVSDKLYLINVIVDPRDISPALRRLTDGLRAS